MKTLIDELKDYDDRYYNDGMSTISDSEYDSLKEIAKLQFPDDPYFLQVGAKVKSDKKIKFDHIMGSLEKYKPDTIEKFLAKFTPNEQFYVTPKLDGMSIICKFEKGQLIWAASRGDGIEGEDITRKIAHIHFDIPCNISCLLRGEVVLRGDLYKKIGMANRRNGVVGIVGRDDDKYVEMLNVIFYEIIEISDNSINFLDELFGIGNEFIVNAYIALNKDLSAEFLTSYYKRIKEDMAEIDLDGLVINPLHWKRENVKLPKNKISYKVNEAPTRVKVDRVEWSTSRTGRIVPVVNFAEATLLSGAMVLKATGFNADFIIKNKIGHGSEVGILRSGEVIPYIAEIYTPSTKFEELSVCPGCGQPIIKSGVDYLCPNPKECRDSQYLQLQHWVVELGAESIKEATLRALNVDSIEKLYSLSHWKIMNDYEGFGERSADIIIAELKKTLQSTPERLLAAMGVSGVGTRASEKIFAFIRKDLGTNEKDSFEAFISHSMFNFLSSIDGIGLSIVAKIEENIESIRKRYETMKSYGFTFKERKSNSNKGVGMLSGKKICMTGAGPLPRKQLEEMIDAAGGINGSMAKDTEILVCADPSSGSSKLQKAVKFGTKIISYEELMQELGA